MEAIRKAALWIGVPYLLHGRDPNGWDCLGCMTYGRRELFGLDSPGVGEARYRRRDVADAATVEDMISAKLNLWTETERRPGAVGLFMSYGRPAHVGLFLDAENVLHCERDHATVIQSFATMKERLRRVYDC